MEAVIDAPARFGRPMERDRDGHGGGGQLFLVRRETDFQGGLLSEKGYNGNYLAFRPSDLFMRVLGDDVLRLNDALFEFRGQAVSQLLLFEDDALQAHYGELNRRAEVVRDRIQALIEYCNKGFDRLLDEALQMAEEWGQETPGAGDDGLAAMKAFGPLGPDVFEALRRRNVEEGVLTELGSEQGYVAFKSCPFYGRVVGEVVYHVQRGAQAGGGANGSVHSGGPGKRGEAVRCRTHERDEAAARGNGGRGGILPRRA